MAFTAVCAYAVVMLRRTVLRSALLALLLLAPAAAARACIWDSDTLADEKKKSPQRAQAILNPGAPIQDKARLRERISRLEATPRQDDPEWWNDLAGAHLRLGEPRKAVELLEPAVLRFPKVYGVHANLGTAYHLLGRYQEAEREIARDLEINPEAHFGLEKYHLALLQYLSRSADYRRTHVYVDEWTESFLVAHSEVPHLAPSSTVLKKGVPLHHQSYLTGDDVREGESPAMMMHRLQTRAKSPGIPSREVESLKRSIRALEAMVHPPPAYRYRWDLAADPKFEDGVVYMATLNSKEPACFVMLGIASWGQRDLNLAVAAFERAIKLGSPQSELLRTHIKGIRSHQRQAAAPYQMVKGLILVALGIPVLAAVAAWWWRRSRKRI